MDRFWRKLQVSQQIVALCILTFASLEATSGPLAWPLRCADGSERNCIRGIGYPDLEKKNVAANCGKPGYQGHTGTDLPIRDRDIGKNHEVLASADGEVIFTFDGKYDNCPNPENPDCNTNPPKPYFPGYNEGVTTCSTLGPWCRAGGRGQCYWCFTGGNYVVIRHVGIPNVFATYYAHLQLGSVKVQPGDRVKQGDVLGIVASSGHSTGPHLHFELWDRDYYQRGDPWPGPCGPNRNINYWQTREQKLTIPTRQPDQEMKPSSFSQFD